MVKNLPTVERSTKIRFGKNCTNDQAENTIVFNASEGEIDTPFTDSVYITPLRLRTDLSDRNISVLAYNQVTKEMMDSGAVAEDILNFTLEAAVINGNVTSNTLSFNNVVTSATTLSNVGIANAAPTDTLSVGSKVFVNQTASNTVRILGSTYIQNSLVVDGDATFNGLVTTLHSNNTVIRDAILEIGKDNVVGDASLDLGFIMTRPGSNIAVGYLESSNEFAIGYTQSSANHHTITPLTTQDINVHVYGQIFTESNVGVMNTNPVHTLDVGSNLFVDDFGSNILVVTGNTSISADLTVDGDTLFVDSGADKVGINTLTPSAELHVVGNAYISSNLTVDTNTLHVDVESNRVGINQINPTKDLDVNGTIAATRRVDNSGYDRLLIGTDTGATIHPSSNAHLISLGYRAGYDRQHSNSIAIGYKSGSVTQAESSIAIGERSGETNQGNSSIAIGEKAAYENQAASSIAIGENAGGQDQLGNSIAIGKDAGSQNQGQKSIAIGDGAGKFNQGEGAIAIGYYAGYPTGQAAGSVIINGGTDAAGFNNTTTQNALFINPVRNVNNSNILMYNADSKEFTYGTTIHNTVNVSNNFTVDTDTLFVDSVNDSVGINNASPDANLHVVGNVYVSSNLTVDLNTLHVDTNKHFVGIETNHPDATLHVVGNAYILNDLTVDIDTLHVDSTNNSVGIETKTPDANLHVVGNVYVSSNLTVDTDTLHVDTTTHSVGIETKTPDANLHVVGNTYVSSNLTVDTDTLHVDSVTHSVGVETNSPDANLHVVGNVYVSSNLTVNTDTLHVDSVNNSVGIETVTPDANLHVVGNTYISSNLTVDTNTLHVDTEADHIGINTVTPSAELHVVGNVFVTSNVSIADTTATSSKTTGALKVGGGLGIAGDIHATNTYFEDVTANSILVTDSTVTSSKTTGALRVSGGLGVVGDIHATNTYFEDATANSVLVTDTTVTSSKTTGALIVTGGLGITGAIHGSAVNFEGVEADSLHVTNTTSTTSKTTGAARLAGGLGVAGNIHATHVNFEDVVADSLTIEDTTLSTSKTTGSVIVAGGIGVTDNVYASRFVGDGGLLSNIATNLQSISENGNTTSNIIQFTGTETSFVSHSNVGIANTQPDHTLSVGTNFYVNEDGANTVVVDGNVSVSSNLTVGSNIAIVGLSVDKFPIVGSTKFLEDSIITKDGPDIIISGGLQVTGNIFQTGNVFVVDSNNTVIQDRILTLANNNTQSALDVGIIMEYPGHNIAIAHHGDEAPKRLSIGYTLNKHTDTQIDGDSNNVTLDVLGNLQVQNNFTVDTTTFHVDTVTERVGILTATPAYTLDVHGNSNVAVARSKSSVVTDGTDSGSKTTGAVTIIGGLGVGKNIHAKDVNFEAATLDSATIQNVTSTTNKTSGALIVGGGIGVSGNIHASNVNFEDAEIDSLTVTDTTPTNSKTSGAVQIAGGLGVVGAIHGSAVNFEGAEVDNLTVTDTTISTSTGSGAVKVAGGLGVTGNVYAAKFYGDGSTLTGLVTRLEDVTNNGNTTSNTMSI